ncbi:MAG: DUF2341 domain-containing protein [Candidatus Brocadiia bacterium]
MLKNNAYKKLSLVILIGLGILSYGGFCEDQARQVISGSSAELQSPSGLGAATSSANLITLSWTDNSGNEDGFRIERKTGISGTYQSLVTLPANSTVYSDSAVSEVTLYYYRVFAYNTAGESLPSNEASATTLWTITTVDSAGNVGGFTSMAIDSSNKMHISYYDYSNADLKYATNESGSWVSTAVESVGDIGEFSSIAVDSNNKVHISYYDRTNTNLKYATNISGAWLAYTVDAGGHNGFYSSISIDSDNKAHIGYYNSATSDLKYATNASGSWQTSTVDSAGQVGLFLSLVVDHSNKVHISYYDQTNGDLKYVTNISGQWVAIAVDSIGDVGFYTDIAIDSNNKVNISYGDWTNRNLKYATNALGSWQMTTIDAIGDVGDFTSIAVDSKNNSHISYYDSTNKALKYARYNAGLWTTGLVDSNEVGQYGSICLGTNQAFISYLDIKNWDLKFASNSAGNWQVIPAPSGLAAVSMSNTQINLSWIDNSTTEDGFKIERRSEFESDFSEVASLGPNVTTWSNPGLTVYTLYIYRVKAYSASDSSLSSNESSARTLYAQPGVSTLLTPADGSVDVPVNALLVWNAATNTATYLLQVSPVSSFASTTINVEVGGISYAAVSLANLTTYYWRVQAKNPGGAGSWSAVFSFTTIIAAPDKPTVSSPTSGVIDMSINPILFWNAAARASYYRLQVSADSDFSSLILDQANLTATSYALSSLANLTAYYWRVNATNIGGVNVWSDTASFTTIIAAPATAPVLATPADGATWLSFSPTFSWSAVNTASSYRIQVSTASDFSVLVVDQSGIAVTLYQGATLDNNVIFYWRVWAANNGGIGPWSGTSSFTTALSIPLAPVLSAPANNAGNIAINPTLVWNITNGAASYRLQLSADSSFASTIVDQSGITGTSLAVTGLANLTAYYWRVNATNITGTGPWSSVWSFTTIIAAPAQPVLSAPADAAGGTALNPTLSWDAAARALTYAVQVATDALFSSLIVNQNSISGISYQVSGLLNNTVYYWRVKSVNIGGESIWSLYRTFTTIVVAPVLTSPANNATLVAVNPTLVWSDVAGATVYQVQVATDSSFAWIILDQAGLNVTTTGLSGLANYTPYYWRVKAGNAGGTSGWSAVFKFTTIIAAPDKPILSSPGSGVTGIAVNPFLQWGAAARAAYYRLQTSVSASFATTINDQNNINLTFYNLSGLVNNTMYYWRVSSINAGGTSDWSDTGYFTTIIAAPPVPALSYPASDAVDIPPSATLLWNPSSDAVSYGLQISTVINFATTVINQSGITATSYAINPALNYSSVYYWRVNASNAGGTSGWSLIRKFTVAPQPPAQPVLSSPADNVTGQWLPPALQWNVDTNVHSYILQVATSSDFASPVVSQSGIAANSFQPGSLLNNTLYYWKVKAVNNGGQSDWSSYRRFKTVISTPTLVSPANEATGVALSPTVEWGASFGVTSYRINIATDSGFGNIIVNQNSVVTSYAAALSSGVTYYWRVSAANAEGISPWSTARSFTTIPPIPAQPQLNSPADAATRISSSPALKWDSANYASNYRLQVVTGTDFSVVPLAFDQSGIVNTYKAVTVLANDTQYSWRVNASNISGSSAWSAERSFRTIPVVPDQPTLISPTNSAAGLFVNFDLEWDPVTNTTVTYRLRIASDMSFSTTVFDQDGIATTSRNVSGIFSYAKRYYYQVKAIGVNLEESDWSAAWTFTTLIGTPSLSSPRNGVINFPNSPVFGWDQAIGADKYRLQVALDSGFVTIVFDQSNISSLTYPVAGLNYSSTYYWRVQASSPDVTSDWSSGWNFRTTVNISNPGGGWWGYYKPITISNTSATIANYQVVVNPFNDAIPLNNNGLVLSLHFNDTVGTVNGPVLDRSNYFNAATLSGFNSPNGIISAGKFGNGLSFDRSNDYVGLTLSGVDISTANAKTSVEFWMYWDGVEGVMPFGWTDYYLYFAGGAFGFNTAEGNIYGISSAGLANRWVHVVAIFNNGDITLGSIFIDGVQKVLSQQLGGPTNSNRNIAATARISGWNTNNLYRFGGTIDEFKMYNRVLSTVEVQAHYNAGSNTGSNRIKSDYADIRFTNSDMSQELSFWQEADNRFWVKVPSLPNGNTIIRMLYGNVAASASSDITNTFIFGEDFSTGTLSASKWTSTSLLYYISSGVLNGWSDGTSWKGLTSAYTCGPSDAVIWETMYKSDAVNNVRLYFEQSANRFAIQPWPGGTGPQMQYRENGGSYTNGSQYATTSANTWYIYRITRLSSIGFKAITLGSNYNQLGTDTKASDYWNSVTFRLSQAEYSTVNSCYDWIRVRKYLAVEPTTSVGAENSINSVSNMDSIVVSTTQINIFWQDNSDNEDYFEIERSPDGLAWAQIATATANSMAYSDTGLTPDTDYYYRVKPYNLTIGDGAVSNVTINRTSIPAVPSGLITTTVTSSSVSLQWMDNSNNEDGFKVQRKTALSGTYADYATLPRNTTSWTDNNVLLFNRYYYYRVYAYNNIGDSSTSNEIFAIPNFSNNGNGNWAYFKTITATNTGSALTDYQVQINPFTDSDFINNTGLVGSWHFSESLTDTSTVTTDMSGLGNNGTLTSSPTRVVGRFGNALSFNNTNMYVSVPDKPEWNFGTNSFTIELWAKWNSLADIESIIGQSNGGGNNLKWSLVKNMNTSFAYNNTLITFNFMNPAGTNYFASWNWTANTTTWYHISVVRNGSNWYLYVNGVETGGVQTQSAAMPDVSSNLRIGTDGEAWNYLNGLIDEVRIYNRALVASEIVTRYNAGTFKISMDYKDVRFANSDLTAELPYWQEADNRFWIKIPSILAGDTPIKMFYGNASATSSSNGYNVFDFFDDFDNYTAGGIDGQGGWTQTGSGTTNDVSTNRAISGKSLRHWYNSGYGTVYKSIPAQTNAFVAEWNQNHIAANSGLCFGDGTLYGDYNGGWVTTYNSTGKLLYYKDAGDYNLLSYTLDRWYRIKTVINPVTQNIKVSVNDTGPLYDGDMRGNVTSFDKVLVPLYTSGYNTYIDNIRIRKYSAVEPAATVISAEVPINQASNLAANVVSGNQVDLVWNDNSFGELGFKIEKSFDAGNWTEIWTTSPNINIYSDTTVTPTGVYYYRVRSYDDGGNHPYSSYITATTIAPIAPTNLLTNTVTTSAISLSWNDNSVSENGFYLERSSDGAYWAVTITVPANITSYADTSLSMNTVYYYRLLAFNGIGNSSYSNVISSTTVSLSNGGGGKWQYFRQITVANTGSNLTDYQVQINPFNDSNFINNTGLVGSWHFSEPLTDTSTAMADMSGSGNNGTSGTVPTRVPGRFGNALSFDGSGNYYVTLSATPILGTGSFAIESWIKTAITDTRKQIINFGVPATANQGVWFFVNASNQLEFDLSGAAGPTSAAPVTDGNWHHVCAVYNGTNVQLYIDGSANGSPVAMSPNIQSSAYNAIGARADAFLWYFNGLIDEVRIYNRSLSLAEIQAQYNAGTPKVRHDYTDIRFTDAAMTREFPYWQETDNKFWVKIPSLPAGNTHLKMFYGNASATDSSSGTDTFIFFDDFIGPSIDTNKWQASGTYQTIENGRLKVTGGTGSWDSGMYSKQAFDRDNWAVEADFQTYGSVNSMWGVNQANPSDYSYDKYPHNLYPNNTTSLTTYEYASNTGSDVTSFSQGSPYKFRIMVKASSGASYYISTNGGNTYQLCRDSTADGTSPLRIGYAGYSRQFYIDNWRIRKYAAVEPMLTLISTEVPVNQTSNLVATVVSGNRVDLAWDDNSLGESGFKIERSPDGSSWIEIGTALHNITVYSDTTVTPTNTYYYRVRSYDFLLDHLYSNTELTRTSLPDAPSGLITTTVSSSSITLQWVDNANNETGFEVWSSMDGITYTLLATLDRNTTSYTDSGLLMGTAYAYKVRAYNGIGGDYSNIISSITPIMDATGGTITYFGNYKIHTFTSSGTFTATGGDVEVFVVAGGGSGGHHTTSNGNGGGGGGGVIYNTSFAVTGQAYTVTVGNGGAGIPNGTGAAGNNGQNSVFSSLTAIGGGGGGSTAGYSGKNGGSGGGSCGNSYGYGVSTQTGGYGNSGGNGAGTLQPGGGGGGASSAGVATNGSLPGNGGTGFACSITGSLKYYAGGGGGGGNSSERAGDGFDGGGRGAGTTSYYAYNFYPVEVNATTRGSSTPNAIANTGGGGGGGSYWATSYCTGSGAGGSGIVIVRYLIQSGLNITTNLVAQVISETSVKLTWQDNSPGENGFKIERSPDGSSWAQIDTVPANTTVYTDTSVSAVTAYYYRVRSYNFLVNHQYSNTEPTRTALPDAPSGLITTTVSSLSIALQWNDDDNETGFEVWRSMDGVTYTLLATLGRNVITYTDSAVLMATAYAYKIRAYNGIGNSNYSSPVSQITLSSVVATGGTITYLGGYPIHTFTSSGVFTVTSGGNIEVYAWGGGGAGGTVGGWSYGAPGGAGGAAQGILSATSGAIYNIVVGGGGVVWSYPTGATGGGGPASNNNSDNRYSGGGGGYSGIFASSVSQANALIIAGGGGGGGSSRAGTGNAGGAGGGSSGQQGYSPYLANFGGNPGTQSSYGVDVTGQYSTNIGFGGQGALQGGMPLMNSYGGGGGGGYWGGSAGGYQEPNSMSGGGGGSGYLSSTAISSGVLTAGSGTIPGDSANSLRGTAGDAGVVAGNGYSGIVIVKCLTNTAVNIATNLVAKVNSATEVVLTWQDNSPGENGFKIERSPDGSSWTQIDTVPANTTVYTNTGLSAGTTYYYRVRSYNFLVNHPYSNQDIARTVAPLAPSNLTAAAVTIDITLQWTNNSLGEQGFQLERSLNGTSWTVTQTITANTTVYTDTGLANFTTYWYRIRSYNGLGVSTYSNIISATTFVVVNVTFNPTGTGQTGTIQNWTAPYTGVFHIEVWGAQGGQGSSYTQYTPGKGARMRGDFNLTAGTQLKILVGQQGPSGTYDGGGGGGTFVTDNSNSPLIIAGGGGGSSYNGSGVDATTSNNGTAGQSGGTGGTGGSGGTSGGYAGPGGGLTGNGGTAPSSGLAGGYAFINGGNGGPTGSYIYGGFGGGGGTHGNGWGGGGGGGYSGGGASNSSQYGGGGGGSYNAGTNQDNTGGVRTGSGLVIITN